MAGRFPILVDEHVPVALVHTLRAMGFPVTRVVDEPGLGKGADDEVVFPYAAERGLVWLTRDERASSWPVEWRREGRPFRGMLCWPQRHHRRMSVGEVAAFIKALSEEEDPFEPGIRWIKPES